MKACTLGLKDDPPAPQEPESVPHASVHVPSGGNGGLLHLVCPPPRLPSRTGGVRAGGIGSVLAHTLVATLLVALAIRSGTTPTAPEIARREPLQLPRMVFLQHAEPGGGGGGGGDGKRMQPSRPRAQAGGRGRLIAPLDPPVVVSDRLLEPVTTTTRVVLDARPLAATTDFWFGLPDAQSSLPYSGGPGSGGGVGSGTGSGVGPGIGSGIGPGSGGGFGGGGSSLVKSVPIHEPSIAAGGTRIVRAILGR
jgi:hypothetical protein